MAKLDDEGAKATVDTTVDALGAATIHLAGELDISNVPEVEARIGPTIEQAERQVVFDLTGLTFMDSSGIAMLLRTAGRTATLEVRNPSDTVRSIIDATGLADVLHLAS